MVLKIIPNSANFKGLSLITGFHGIGAAGFWTIKYLLQELKAERIAIIDSDTPAPMASNNDGKLVSPFEFYRKDNLIFFKVETPLYKDEDMIFFKELSDFIVDVGFKEAALIGGLDSRLKTDNSTFRLVKTSAYKSDSELEKSTFLEDGQIIVGPIAVMLNRFEARNFPAYSLLSYASAERVDPRAAVAALNALSGHYGFKIDTAPLLKGADVLETELEQTVDPIKQHGNAIYS
jgi:predicted ATP-grasp superfamily ATP-dependent carboligase|tara:strand:- start:5742 stop:6443 length:702 start_codon:yes stop_codon:yes gene_type:complete